MINLVQVGLGYWGKNLIRNLRNLGVLYAACDANKDTLNKYMNDATYNGIRFDEDYSGYLNDDNVDGAVIATPPNTHFRIARDFLAAEKHVFVEKPMTTDVEDAHTLVNMAEYKKLILSVGHIFLYAPEIIKLKEIISSKEFGDIYYIYTQRLNLGKIQDCGVVHDLAAHDISILDYLLDDTCDELNVSSKGHILNDVSDVAFVSMRYKSGVMCNLHLSWMDPRKIRNIVVVGSKQMVTCDSLNKKVDIYNTSVDYDYINDQSNKSYASHLLTYKYGDVLSPYIGGGEPMVLELEDFAKCIKTGGNPIANGMVGVSVVGCLDAMERSAKNGGVWTKV